MALLVSGGGVCGAYVAGIRGGAGLALACALAAGLSLFWLVRPHPRKVPVLNYHSVSASARWMRTGVRDSMAPAVFERQLRYLQRNGYRTVCISEVRAMLEGETPVPPGKVVALTFDDGYADNWIAAFPLLKQYRMKATIFVSTGFVAAAECCRQTIEGKTPAEWGSLDWSGYLTWPELNAMRDSGLVEVQCHGHEHTRVFTGSAVKGFVGPGEPNLWLFWNTRPDSRGQWWRELDGDRSLWGHPVYAQNAALAQRAFRPDPKAVAHMLSWAKGAGAGAFATPGWAQVAREEWVRYGRGNAVGGEWESVEAYGQRVEQDLALARRILRDKMGIESDVLCWPENAFSEVAERAARKVGFAATVSNRHDTTNAVGEVPGRIVRVYIGSPAAGMRASGLDFAAFVLELNVARGWYILYPLLAAMHLAKKAMGDSGRHWGWTRDSQ